MAAKTRGRVFDIQRMSLHDGPGIRTVVFLKGCPLRCFWCHNPESWRSERDLQVFPERCVGCGLCAAACPQGCHRMEGGAHAFDRAHCDACGGCAAVCPAGSLVFTGEDMGTEELLEKVMRDRPFYAKSGGGVTFSGGEPLLQAEFVREAALAVKALGVNTALETSAYAPYRAIEPLLGCVDYFLVDLKHPDSEAHKRFTGVGNERILENITRLDRSGARYGIRIPVIPGVNDSTDVFERINGLLAPLRRLESVELMPYHPLGLGKLASLGHSPGGLAGLAAPTGERLERLAGRIRAAPATFRTTS